MSKKYEKLKGKISVLIDTINKCFSVWMTDEQYEQGLAAIQEIKKLCK